MNEMDRMLNRFFENGNAPGSRGFAADIAETADGYRIEADLPGFTPAEVDLGVKDNLLTIEAKAPKVAEKKEKDEDNPSWHIRERVEGDRKRSFILPEDVDKSTLEGRIEETAVWWLNSRKSRRQTLHREGSRVIGGYDGFPPARERRLNVVAGDEMAAAPVDQLGSHLGAYPAHQGATGGEAATLRRIDGGGAPRLPERFACSGVSPWDPGWEWRKGGPWCRDVWGWA